MQVKFKTKPLKNTELTVFSSFFKCCAVYTQSVLLFNMEFLLQSYVYQEMDYNLYGAIEDSDISQEQQEKLYGKVGKGRWN